MKQRDAKFTLGEIVRHKVFPFRGVVIDVDPEYANTEEWWNAIPADIREIEGNVWQATPNQYVRARLRGTAVEQAFHHRRDHERARRLGQHRAACGQSKHQPEGGQQDFHVRPAPAPVFPPDAS